MFLIIEQWILSRGIYEILGRRADAARTACLHARCFQAVPHFNTTIPDRPFTALDPHDQEICGLYEGQERLTTDFEAPKLRKSRSGSYLLS